MRLKVPFATIDDFSPVVDQSGVRVTGMINRLSKSAPSIVVFTLCAALVGAWIGVPTWLPSALAGVVGTLALLLFLARVRRHEPEAEQDADHPRSWIGYELAGKGTPPGYYMLAFFGLLTILLTGFQSAYAAPAWAGFALGIVWGLANRTYPVGQEADC